MNPPNATETPFCFPASQIWEDAMTSQAFERIGIGKERDDWEGVG